MWALLPGRPETWTKPTCRYYCAVMTGLSVGLALGVSPLGFCSLQLLWLRLQAVVLHKGGLVPGPAWGHRLLRRSMPPFQLTGCR